MRKDHRNHGAAAFHELPEECILLLVLPGAEAIRTHEDRRSAYRGDLVFERLLSGPARGQLPGVEPGLQPVLHEPLADLLDRGFVGAVVAQENVEFHLDPPMPRSCRV